MVCTMTEQPFPQVPKSLRFSTRGIIPDNRIDMWEGHNAKALIPLDIRTIDNRLLHASETNLHLPSIRMASVFGTSQVVERSESFISENPTGVIAVFFATHGDAFFYHQGGHVSLRPGEAIVYDADRPFIRGFNHRFRELVLTIPKQRYRDVVGPQYPELPICFDFGASGTPSQQALARLVNAALKLIDTDDEYAACAASAAEELSWAEIEEEAFGLLRNVLGGAPSSADGIISAAKSHIELHIGDRNLGPGHIAAAVGISERQLSRIFADADTTVGRYVLQQRLGFAKAALSSREQDVVSVGEIGKRFGFSSPSHFSRTFRQRFGLTPLQWRKDSQRQDLQP